MERKKPRGPPDGGIFDKMLEEPCPYHKGGANHKLKDCRMLRKHFDGRGFKKDTRDDSKKEKGGSKEDNKEQGGRQLPHRPRLLHDLWWALDVVDHEAAQKGAP